MKKSILFILAAAAFVFAACQESIIGNVKGEGYISFSDFSLGLDETVLTKASAASGNYMIMVLDAEGNEVFKSDYSTALNNGNKISVPVGNYTFVARSRDGEVPYAEFEAPIYGATKEFSIAAGQTVNIGEVVCTLLQCKVTVAYSDEFLATVTGAGSTKVTLTAGHPLEFALNADRTYNQDAGYFAVNGNTIEVVFSGSIDGKTQKMTKVFSNVAPRQWRQIKFVPKKNEQGQATFDIVINDLIDDATLNNCIDASENIIGDDPDAPKGDGGITLALDYAAGCDKELTDLNNLVIVPVEERVMNIRLRATVPGGVKKFTVDITSDSESFLGAVDLAQARHLDLINPKPENAAIFQVVPFPHGDELLGRTDIEFNLSSAQEAILLFPGKHVFTMTIIDQEGCRNQIPVTMVVK